MGLISRVSSRTYRGKSVMLPISKNVIRPFTTSNLLLGINGRVYKRQNPLIEIDMKVKSAQRQFNYDCKDLGAWGQNNETLYPPIHRKKRRKRLFPTTCGSILRPRPIKNQSNQYGSLLLVCPRHE